MTASHVPPLTVRATAGPRDPYPVFAMVKGGRASPVHGWTYPPRPATPIKR